MAVYDKNGKALLSVYSKDGIALDAAYDRSGSQIYPSYAVPSGDLTADTVVPLPDINDTGHGFTCTGITYDPQTGFFLVGDIGKELPGSSGFASKIVKFSLDFLTAEGTIQLSTLFPNMEDVQGITMDTSDRSIWFCSPHENLVRHISAAGSSLGSFAVTGPTGIAYSAVTDSFWVMTYGGAVTRYSKTGEVLETYNSTIGEALDQCFLDEQHGYLYITAGTNYQTRNNVYKFDLSDHTFSTACTVDSYSVEGIWIGPDSMILLNDGYYHSAYVPVNQVNIYEL